MDHYLYEYRNHLPLAELPPGLEAYLQTIWERRPRTAGLFGVDSSRSTRQRYLEFSVDAQGHRTVRARNYVGLIQYQGHRLHLLPKVFYESNSYPAAGSLEAIHAHLYWWLSYSVRLQFPRSLASFSQVSADWLELLVLLFAQYTHELLSRSQYQYYQQVEQELNTLRGRLNFIDYVRNRSVGRQHVLPCTFDSFQPDNQFNRILKDVVSRLRLFTRHSPSRQLLEDISFLLAEVSDQPASLADCDQVQLPPLFADFNLVLTYCRFFLASHSPLASTDAKEQVFALLLPTEKVFEDFIGGFLQQHFQSSFQITAQASDLYLARQMQATANSKPALRFKLQHDILLRPWGKGSLTLGGPIVIDCKYKTWKLVEGALDQKGISQADMYQLVSYAIRRGSKQNYLFYPDSLSDPATDATTNHLEFEVTDSLANTSLSITALRLPVVAPSTFLSPGNAAADFMELERELISRLEQMLKVVPAGS
ncbi:McrC family protein [Hymenobacter actinosclerus]|uniref:5-methylcytosine-specific restriction enzyme subunit McrC n=1 Tax=Hymenobacter actinosclerus TaxID=82805 RepID=A0A1I0ILY5_9BACT|nr:hypothetical protein [Hymenobacter actinosclerus]SET98080.1 5-methylcytosine-specific restriction enzyme subunit McrC [Hymenobacter actinosclerus]